MFLPYSCCKFWNLKFRFFSEDHYQENIQDALDENDQTAAGLNLQDETEAYGFHPVPVIYGESFY